MRLIANDNDLYLRALSAAIAKDPASFESWQFMHFEHCSKKSFEWPKAALNALKDKHHIRDCDIVICDDKDIICVGPALNNTLLHKLAAVFAELIEGDTGQKTNYAVYDILSEWRNILAVLMCKVDLTQTLMHSAPTHNFGEISSLDEIFAEAKMRRKGRMPLHVMVVEDDAVTRRIVTNTFKTQYAVITAESAEEAVTNYLLHAPDIVFLDIGLPDTNGFEVLHRILQTDSDAYVVMFSGNSYMDNILKALGIGASGFVGKPFTRDRMQSYIQTSAQHHRKFL